MRRHKVIVEVVHRVFRRCGLVYISPRKTRSIENLRIGQLVFPRSQNSPLNHLRDPNNMFSLLPIEASW